MALPMQPQQPGYSNSHQLPTSYAQPVAAAHPPSSMVTPYPPAPLGSPYAPATDLEQGQGDDGYPAGSFLHAPLTAHVGVGASGQPGGYNASGADWAAPAAQGDRPSIRPPVASPLQPGQSAQGNAGGQGRRTAGGQSLGGDDLGIEESEYDTPAYLRRSRGSQSSASAGHDYSALGFRMPGDK
jgi:hypothetical protein